MAYPPPHDPYGQYGPYVPRAVPTSGIATASLVFGIISILGGVCLCGITSAVAVVTGHIGMAETKHGLKSGRGGAVAGLILGYLTLVPFIVLVALYLAGVVTYDWSSVPGVEDSGTRY